MPTPTIAGHRARGRRVNEKAARLRDDGRVLALIDQTVWQVIGDCGTPHIVTVLDDDVRRRAALKGGRGLLPPPAVCSGDHPPCRDNSGDTYCSHRGAVAIAVIAANQPADPFAGLEQ